MTSFNGLQVFHKKFSESEFAIETNYQLANELHMQIVRKFTRQKVYPSFRDNIVGVDLTDM